MVNKASILVVEDSDDDFETISEAAEKASVSFPIVHARDAFEAARLVGIEGDGGQRFALMILDYNLPGKTGGEFLREFSRIPGRHLTPVIVFTTSSNLVECRECYEAGANAFHTKSVQYKDCLQTLRSIFDYWLRSAILPLKQESD